MTSARQSGVAGSILVSDAGDTGTSTATDDSGTAGGSGGTGASATAADSTVSSCGHAGVADPTLTRDEAVGVAELFKVLGDPTRVLILRTLSDAGELCVHHLAEAVGMSQSSVSHHLRLLRATALVRGRRVGREVYYRPDDEHVEQLIDICAEHIVHAGGGADPRRTGVDPRDPARGDTRV
jgi:DNA-binding transcriptional ArsR family regulator